MNLGGCVVINPRFSELRPQNSCNTQSTLINTDHHPVSCHGVNPEDIIPRYPDVETLHCCWSQQGQAFLSIIISRGQHFIPGDHLHPSISRVLQEARRDLGDGGAGVSESAGEVTKQEVGGDQHQTRDTSHQHQQSETVISIYKSF